MNGNPDATPSTTLASRRTSFAEFRTSLALERTTLAWIRTTGTFATFGFGMIGFFRALELSTHSEHAEQLHLGAVRMGVALVVLGLAATIFASFEPVRALDRLRRRQELSIAHRPLSGTVAVLLALLGFYGLWSVFAG